jgi:hypothetical protein
MLLHDVAATLVTPSNVLHELQVMFEIISFVVAESVERSAGDIWPNICILIPEVGVSSVSS